MSENNNNILLEKGIEFKNNATSVLLPNVINNTILVESTLVVLLATLSEPNADNISLYHYLFCTLLLSIALGVLCTSIIAIDFYTLGNKVLTLVKKAPQTDDQVYKGQIHIRTGKFFLYSIIFCFAGCLILFLISLGLLVKYAW